MLQLLPDSEKAVQEAVFVCHKLSDLIEELTFADQRNLELV